MSPVSHFFLGWLVAESDALGRRDRALVTLAGVAPDLDGLGAIPELLTRNTSHPLLWFTAYHHLLGHNLGFALAVAAATAMLGIKKWQATSLAFLSFHLHLFCDLIGARGPDGYQWPIPYLEPFSSRGQWSWHGQWALNAWPNFLITGVALGTTIYLAWRRGYSPLGIFSTRADQAFVTALCRRFPRRDISLKQAV